MVALHHEGYLDDMLSARGGGGGGSSLLFCYLGDMLSAGGGVEEAVRFRVRCAWGKFNELMPILTMRGTSLKVKGKIYRACEQSVMMYGSENLGNEG